MATVVGRRSRVFAQRGGLALVASLVLLASRAEADPPYVSRRLTLTQGEFGVDVGFAVADDARDDVAGTGLYGQVGYGITDRIEVSVRDGANFGLYGRYSHAEQYGRLYTTDGVVTPSTGTLGDPDLTLLGRFVDLGFLELAADAELTFPVESGTHVAATVGLIAVLHYDDWLRFDTGVYATATFVTPTELDYAVPMELWIQPTTSAPFWFGPVTALRTIDADHRLRVPLGVGAGYSVTPDIDLRAEWLIPQINVTPGIRDMGFGAGAQVRF
jgi:hypothetical protein